MKSWKVSIKTGLFVVAMLVLTVMNHTGLAESD